MPRYTLTKLADNDLLNITLYGIENFDLSKAEEFKHQLIARFETIAKQPLLYPAVDHIHEGYRRSVFKKLSIYYRNDKDGVVIIRILGQQNLERSFDV